MRISDWSSDVCSSDLHRLYAVLDKELGERPYLASDDYSIADIATYPWIARFPLHGLEWAAVPNVKRWFDAVGARPAVASRSEEHTSELQSLMRSSYAVFCLKKKKLKKINTNPQHSVSPNMQKVSI